MGVLQEVRGIPIDRKKKSFSTLKTDFMSIMTHSVPKLNHLQTGAPWATATVHMSHKIIQIS